MKFYALRLVDSILVMENNVYYMELNLSTESYAHGRGRNFLGDEISLILNLKWLHFRNFDIDIILKPYQNFDEKCN